MPTTTQQVIISLFDFTGHMVAPWAEAGLPCYSVDLKHPVGENRNGNIVRVGADVREWLPPYTVVRMLFAFPKIALTLNSDLLWRVTTEIDFLVLRKPRPFRATAGIVPILVQSPEILPNAHSVPHLT